MHFAGKIIFLIEHKIAEIDATMKYISQSQKDKESHGKKLVISRPLSLTSFTQRFKQSAQPFKDI